MTAYDSRITPPRSFHMEKWYMDVCDDFGNAFIGYSVKLKWKKIGINYRGYIFRDQSGKILGLNRLGDACFPIVRENAIEWDTPEVKGEWKPKLNPIEEIIGLPDHSLFTWDCRQPLSDVKVVIGDDTTIIGNGYAERITLNVVPWKLPITTLYWGRFTSQEHSIVWIQWVGNFPLSLVYVNGIQKSEIEISNKEVRFADGTVIFEELHPLRKGAISETVLKNSNMVRKLFPIKALSIIENKWFCHAAFLPKNGSPVLGQCIHEMVNFG